jgi:putative heme iron utilization protein
MTLDGDSLLLRSLLRDSRVLALGVLVEGAPYVGLLPYVVAADLATLYVRASGMALHTQGLVAGAPFSALVHAAEPGAPDPLQVPRVSFQGKVEPLDRDSDEAVAIVERYVARFPSATMTTALADFGTYALRIRSGRFVGGFARARDLRPEDLRALAVAS